MIRNFLYLDSEKLRSISSQLFEGVTEQVVLSSGDKDSKEESQKGPINSGRVLADIFAQERSTSELRFLEDHAYTLFEERLVLEKMVDDLSAGEAAKTSKSFVKITGRLSINDTAVTSLTLKEFNALGEAQWRAVNEQFNSLKFTPDAEARKKAGEIGLQMNKKFTDSISYLVDFGFKGMLEFSISIADHLFSAPIKRQFLRESEDMLLHKYSRVTQGDFVILGFVTQKGSGEADTEVPPDVADADGIKAAIRAVSLHLRTVEQTFAGPLKNEIVIDPIAVYSII